MISLQNIPGLERIVQEYVKVPARRNFIIKAYRKNLLDDLYNFIGTRDRLCKELPRISPSTAERYIGFIVTSIYRDIPFEYLEMSGFTDKDQVSLFHKRFFTWFKRNAVAYEENGTPEVERVPETEPEREEYLEMDLDVDLEEVDSPKERHVSWLPVQNHRVEGVYSTEEREIIGSNDFPTIKKVVNEKWLQEKDGLLGKPNCPESRMEVQAHLVLLYLVNEDNIRFRPIAELKHFGVAGIGGARENLILFDESPNGPVVCYFNDMKIKKYAPIINVLSEPTASAFRQFYRMYCKETSSTLIFADGQVVENGGNRALFMNKSGSAITTDNLLTHVNKLIGSLGLEGRLTTRFLRILQINHQIPDKSLTFREALDFARRHNHSIEESMLYNRPQEKRESGLNYR